MNSGQFDGLTSAEARPKIISWLAEKGAAETKVNYRMRDWTFSRQRYWGEPIPIVHCERCGPVAVPENQLPLVLPEVEAYAPSGTGESPLADIDEWVNTTCPTCSGPARRETNTMPQWAGSCWYYLRYIDPNNTERLVDQEQERKWMPVDLYVGGVEHATRHLLYARFWHKFLYDIGAVSTKEPFKRLMSQGLILASDGRKMSKRWGNVVNPDEMVDNFGADAFRVYEMFMGPFEQAIAWNTDGVVGARRFLDKVWKLRSKVTSEKSKVEDEKVRILLNQTIKKVTADIENFRFNTAISTLMILANAFEKADHVEREAYERFLTLLAPFAPHITDELWSVLGHAESIFAEKRWPVADERFLTNATTTMVVQVNGKMRAALDVSTDMSEDDVRALAEADEHVVPYLKDKTVRKVVFVPNRLISFVVN